MPLPEGTTTANVKTIHSVHSIHYYQMMMADLIEFEDHGMPLRVIIPHEGCDLKIKGTNIYLRIDDKTPLELKD